VISQEISKATVQDLQEDTHGKSRYRELPLQSFFTERIVNSKTRRWIFLQFTF